MMTSRILKLKGFMKNTIIQIPNEWNKIFQSTKKNHSLFIREHRLAKNYFLAEVTFNPANIYLFKVNNRSTRKRRQINSKLKRLRLKLEVVLMLDQQIGGKMIFLRLKVLKSIHSLLPIVWVRLSLIQLIFFQIQLPVLI